MLVEISKKKKNKQNKSKGNIITSSKKSLDNTRELPRQPDPADHDPREMRQYIEVKLILANL